MTILSYFETVAIYEGMYLPWIGTTVEYELVILPSYFQERDDISI